MEKYLDPNETPMLLTLVDEDGQESVYELLASLEDGGKEYRAVLPYFDDPEEALNAPGELIVLQVEQDENGEEILTSFEDKDEAEYERIGNMFLDMLEEAEEEDWE